jgi:formyltetrahydrofolate deformylase
MNEGSIILLIDCPDQRGLVSRISTFFYQRGFNILHCQQHTDVKENRYFMRLKLDLRDLNEPRENVEKDFDQFSRSLSLRWSVYYSDVLPRVAILATKAPHCLFDLLLRRAEGEIKSEVPLIISNHPTLGYIAKQFGIRYEYLPVTKDTKQQQEAKIENLLEENRIDLVVLARYMQILSDAFVERWTGRIINIHHAFLPAFQGANPYQLAHERGVKMIGATAHYVTAELDEGPIIEQDVIRVSHENSTEELVQMGRDVERVVLARAVKAHLERRLIIHGRRVIVFSTGV